MSELDLADARAFDIVDREIREKTPSIDLDIFATAIRNANERSAQEYTTRIAKLEAALKLAREALRPFSAAHFYDNGDVTTSTGQLRPEHYWDADTAVKQIDEILK